jgi:multidrug efflux system membrane fusion protein
MKRISLSNSVLLAAALLGAVVLWMLTGLVRNDAATSPTDVANPARATERPRVAVRTSRAKAFTREIVVSGRTEPNRSVELRAETEGRVVALGAARGAPIEAGARVIGLDMRDRQARLEEARALIDYAELQFAAARKLQEKQFVSQTQMADLASRVVSARAALERIELEVANTTIVAPFDGMLQERAVEIGDYVNSGDKVAELVDIDPLIVVGEVSERDVHKLAVGTKGTARVIDAEPVEGELRYLSPVASESTRTFRVELAVPNADRRMRAGMTAEIRLAADQITAHVLSPALLTLDDAGAIGVKAVDDTARVVFYPVEVVGSSGDGITVTGLPAEIQLITVGQGFVRPGDFVDASFESSGAGVSEVSMEASPVQHAVR